MKDFKVTDTMVKDVEEFVRINSSFPGTWDMDTIRRHAVEQIVWKLFYKDVPADTYVPHDVIAAAERELTENLNEKALEWWK